MNSRIIRLGIICTVEPVYTGKKNPRIARTSIKWADRDSVFTIIKNAYGFVERHSDKSLDKEHVGYIVDRVGYQAFRDEILWDVVLNDTAVVAENIQWGGYFYANDTELFPKSEK